MSATCLQYGIMLFFAAWCLIMTLYIILCLPETKGVPIEEIVVVWRKHWLWKRFVEPAASDQGGGGQAFSCAGNFNALCIRELPSRGRLTGRQCSRCSHWNNVHIVRTQLLLRNGLFGGQGRNPNGIASTELTSSCPKGKNYLFNAEFSIR